MGTGMGSVSMGRKTARCQRNKPQQAQLQATEMWGGREGDADRKAVAREPWEPPGHALQGRLLS